MKKMFFVVAAFCILATAAFAATPTCTISSVHSATGSALVSWVSPTTNSDGSVLTDLAGFNIYRNTAATGTFTKVGATSANVLSYSDTIVISNNTVLSEYYVVTAFDSVGNESVYPSPVCKTFFGLDTITPSPPIMNPIQ